MKTYVITGATGCLGMALARLVLNNSNNTVLALGRNLKLGKELTRMGATFHAVDLSEKERLIQIAKQADVIFHCAALSSAWGKYDDFYHANVTGTANVIAATPSHAKLVHVSSPSVYFNFKAQYNITEKSPLPKKSANHYIQTKRMAESLVLDAHRNKTLNAIILRPRGIFGPYDRAILPRLMALYHDGVMPIIGDGKQLVDITYVDNAAQSLIDAANAPAKCNGKIYNITNNEPQPFVDLLSQVFKAFHLPVTFKPRAYCWIKPLAYLLEIIFKLPFINQEPPLTPYTAAVMAQGQTLSIERAQRDLGYKATISIKEGIERFALWSKH